MDRRTLLGAAFAAAAATPALAQQPALDPENTLILELPAGRVTIQLLPDLAPRHVERVKTLVRRGFYDNTPFHRVIEGFMAQGGDPTGTGTGGQRETRLPDLPAEFSPRSRARFVRGTCGMARGAGPNTANCQFFIMFTTYPSLDEDYTIWGRVVAGMEAVDRLKRGDQRRNGSVENPDRLRVARIASDS
ncbi:peptidylprolyl isomerase [Neoroseomonas rubea]|uniref:peptidylprolyl isomerase n=1 Tax=Neoroseomonas rubea TaxID=2748666 RepID=UPI0018DFB3D6|nr:peptidylprolyl isomerase [Roseomonas rubea]